MTVVGASRSAAPIPLGWLPIAVAIVLAALLIVLDTIALAGAQATPGLAAIGEGPIPAAIVFTASWSLVAVGLETWRRARRRRLATWLVAIGIAWIVPDLALPTVGSPVLFTVGLAFGWLAAPSILQVLMEIGGRPIHFDRLERLVLALAWVVLVGGLGLFANLLYDPTAAGCALCPANLLSLGSAPALADAATRVAAAGGSLLLGLAIIVAVRRAVTVPATLRPATLAVAIPGAVALALFGVVLVRMAAGVLAPSDPVAHLVRLGASVAVTAMSLGVAVEWLSARRARTHVARLIADLANTPFVGGLRDHLATILGDPDLRLAYPATAVADRGPFETVDATGRPLDLAAHLAPGRTITPIVREGAIVALVEHEAGALRDRSEIDEVVMAARLGLEHERLQAVARAQLATIASARRRIVEAGDSRRRGLERDLHDGAQQSLIALAIGLRLARPGGPAEPLIDDAVAELGWALDDLREIAHGLHPTVLDDEGFAAAVEALAEASPGRLAIETMVDERFSTAVEMAAYRVVADVLEATNDGDVDVRVEREQAWLRIQVTAGAIPSDVVDRLTDRVGAVGGAVTLVVDTDGQTATVTAELPCAS